MVEIDSVSLQPPHGYADLFLPSGPAELVGFFSRCMECRDFQKADSEREQVHIVYEWAQHEEVKGFSLQALGDFFDCSKGTIHYHLSRPYSPLTGCQPGKPGRPPLLNEEQLEALANFINDRFYKRYPVSYEDCRDFLCDKFDLVVHMKSLRSLVSRCENFRTVLGVPMEDSRIYSDPDEIDAYFARIDEIIRIAKIPAGFIFNIDEAGFESYADSRTTTRLVPANYEFDSVPVPISRAEKRATLLAGISADGTTLKPMLILQRDTLEAELILRGYTVNQIHFARSENGYMTTHLFNEWARHSFFPELRAKRLSENYSGPIVLILDGFGCHANEHFLSQCEEQNVIPVAIPPHTSDQVQPLDLGIFANQKRWQGIVRVDQDLNRQTKQVIKIVDSFRMATTFKNVTAAFKSAGIVTFLDAETGTLMARVDTRYASSVRHLAREDIVPDRGQKRRLKI